MRAAVDERLEMLAELAGSFAFDLRQGLIADQRCTIAGQEQIDRVPFAQRRRRDEKSQGGLRRIFRSGMDVNEEFRHGSLPWDANTPVPRLAPPADGGNGERKQPLLDPARQ